VTNWHKSRFIGGLIDRWLLTGEERFALRLGLIVKRELSVVIPIWFGECVEISLPMAIRVDAKSATGA
jgi:hypothetical protein